MKGKIFKTIRIGYLSFVKKKSVFVKYSDAEEVKGKIFKTIRIGYLSFVKKKTVFVKFRYEYK